MKVVTTGSAELARERGDALLDAVAADLDVDDDDRRCAPRQLRQDLVGAFGERVRIGRPRAAAPAPAAARRRHHVARQLDIDRQRTLARAAQHAGDVLRRGRRIGQHRLIAGDLAEHRKLGVDRARLMMQQEAARALARARRAGDHHDRRALGIGAGDRR